MIAKYIVVEEIDGICHQKIMLLVLHVGVEFVEKQSCLVENVCFFLEKEGFRVQCQKNCDATRRKCVPGLGQLVHLFYLFF